MYCTILRGRSISTVRMLTHRIHSLVSQYLSNSFSFHRDTGITGTVVDSVRQPSPVLPERSVEQVSPSFFVFHFLIELFFSPISPLTPLSQQHFLFLLVFRYVINQLISPIPLRTATVATTETSLHSTRILCAPQLSAHPVLCPASRSTKPCP